MAEASLRNVAETGGRRGPDRRLTSIQLIFAVALTIGLILALNLSGRIKLDRDLGRIHAQFTTEIETLRREQQALIAQLSYVKSDAYVEFWARDEGKMIRQGEVLIMPRTTRSAAAEQSAPTPLVDFETTAPEPKNWELWWALFFDAPPPGQE